jgi:hypothetical protein
MDEHVKKLRLLLKFAMRALGQLLSTQKADRLQFPRFDTPNLLSVFHLANRATERTSSYLPKGLVNAGDRRIFLISVSMRGSLR